MSLSEEQDLSSPSPEPFQSAQQPTHNFTLEEDLESSDEKHLETFHPNQTIIQNVDDQITAKPSTGWGTGASQPTIHDEDLTISEDGSQDHIPLPARPNKYHGPVSTWRDWTAPERDLAASLDQLTGKDLSVHLYNAFSLRKKGSVRDKQKLLAIPDDDYWDKLNGWTPPRVWTAWPLPPDDVPREEDEKHWEEEGVLGRAPPSKPKQSSETMKDLLVAHVLRHAREHFLRRESDDPIVETDRVKQVSPAEQPAAGPFNSGQNDSAKNLIPVVLADDERANQILQPTVQHVLTKLDRLLMGLHHARSSYFAIDESASDSQGYASGRSKSRRKAKKRKRSTSNLEHGILLRNELSSGSDENNEPSKRKMSGSKSRPRKQRLGLRDWSDVLGVASMTGWDSEVVKRTAARCASLFGECITFRTLGEGTTGAEERCFLPDGLKPLTPHTSEQPLAKRKAAKEDAMVGGVHVDGFLMPIEGKKSWKYPKKRPKTRSISRSVQA